MLHAKHKTGLVFFPAFDWAIEPGHPEREERLLYTQDQVREEGVFDIDGIVELKPGLATEEDIRRVHFCVPDVGSVTTPSHLISAGGARTIGRAVMEKKVDRGFALVRPPGHHAMRVVHGTRGFCNINIEAIMVEHLRRHYGVRKVAIVDTDCHHGDGTQDIYWHDPDTLFISLHQDGRTLYPGSGFPEDLGGPTALGTTINLPLPPQTGDEGFLFTIREIVLPILADFKPDIIVNSAGQDNHFTDPITNMNFTARGYAQLTELLKPDIAVLEGGYAIEGALPYVNLGIILAMAGMDYTHVVEPDLNPRGFTPPKGLDSWLKTLRDLTLKTWGNRARLREKALNQKPFAQRTRQIYYDTGDISDEQEETLRVCHQCSGALKIESATDSGHRILASHIPQNACPECQALGKEWYDSGNLKQYHQVFLQDRPNDVYLVK